MKYEKASQSELLPVHLVSSVECGIDAAALSLVTRGLGKLSKTHTFSLEIQSIDLYMMHQPGSDICYHHKRMNYFVFILESTGVAVILVIAKNLHVY